MFDMNMAVEAIDRHKVGQQAKAINNCFLEPLLLTPGTCVKNVNVVSASKLSGGDAWNVRS